METNNKKFFDASELTPAYPVHPGGMIGDEIRERGFSQKDFAKKIGMQASQLSAIIHGVRNVTPAVAAKLELGFGNIPAVFWIRLQEKYNVDLQKNRLRTSHLVAGYTTSPEVFIPALAQPEAEYGDKLQYNVTIPNKDKQLFEYLAKRLGWKF